MKNSKFKASQHLIKRNTSNHLLSLTEILFIPIKESTAIDDDKFTNLSKKLELFIPFKNLVELSF